MRGTVNKTILIGNLGQEPETRYAPNGTAITTISVATAYKRGDLELTEWHNVKFIGKLAEIAGSILYKGAKVYVEARSQTDKWDHKDYPVKMRGHWFIANQLDLLSEFQTDEARGAKAQYGHGSVPPGMLDEAEQRAQEDFNDDIPF